MCIVKEYNKVARLFKNVNVSSHCSVSKRFHKNILVSLA